MQIVRTSMYSGKSNTMEINAAPDRLQRYLSCGSQELIQDHFPELTPDEREFLMTGVTPEEWNQMFPDEEE